MTRTHVFAKAAAADLRAIARYTIDQWGEALARRYLQQLEKSSETVGTRRGGAFKDLSAALPLAGCVVAPYPVRGGRGPVQHDPSYDDGPVLMVEPPPQPYEHPGPPPVLGYL